MAKKRLIALDWADTLAPLGTQNLFQGVKQFLEFLKKQNYEVIIISGGVTRQLIESTLKKAEMSDFVSSENIYTRDSVAGLKDFKIYEFDKVDILEWHRVKKSYTKSECLLADDSDVYLGPVKKAGFDTLKVPHKKNKNPKEPVDGFFEKFQVLIELHDYISIRESGPEYIKKFGIFKGYSKTQERDAAQALINYVQFQEPIDPKHKEVLNNERLKGYYEKLIAKDQREEAYKKVSEIDISASIAKTKETSNATMDLPPIKLFLEGDAEAGIDNLAECITKPLIIPQQIQFQVLSSSDTKSKMRSLSRDYHGCNIIALVFDLTNKKSFEDLDKWLQGVIEYAPLDARIYIVANNCDQQFRTISFNEVETFVKKNNLSYFEVDTKTKSGIDKFVAHSTEIALNNSLQKQQNNNNAPSSLDSAIAQKPSSVPSILFTDQQTHSPGPPEQTSGLSSLKHFFLGKPTPSIAPPTVKASSPSEKEEILPVLNFHIVGSNAKTNALVQESLQTTETSTVLNHEKIDLNLYTDAPSSLSDSDQQRPKCISRTHYSKDDIIAIVFDFSDEKPFEDLDKWLQEIIEYASPKACVYIVGNNCNQGSCVVDSTAVDNFIKNMKKWENLVRKLQYFEINTETKLDIKRFLTASIQDTKDQNMPTNKVTY